MATCIFSTSYPILRQYNHPEKECVCGPGVVKRYLSKISGPLLDRIDLHVKVTPVKIEELTNAERRK